MRYSWYLLWACSSSKEWTSEWDKLCLLSEWEWGYSYPNGSVNETLVEWTEGLTEGKEHEALEWAEWRYLYTWFQTKGKDCVKEWTWGVKTDWMLFMISEETARRKEPKVNDWEWSELLLCKEERTNGVTEGDIHLKESELPNEQMDWRLKHNLCVFIWRTEGAIPLGSWNEATVREWDLTQRYIVCGRMNWVNETNNQRLGSLVSCEWASLVSDWVSKRRSESDWLNAVYEKWINSKKLCLVRNGKRVLERAKEWSAHTFLCLFPCEWKTQ